MKLIPEMERGDVVKLKDQTVHVIDSLFKKHYRPAFGVTYSNPATFRWGYTDEMQWNCELNRWEPR